MFPQSRLGHRGREKLSWDDRPQSRIVDGPWEGGGPGFFPLAAKDASLGKEETDLTRHPKRPAFCPS